MAIDVQHNELKEIDTETEPYNDDPRVPIFVDEGSVANPQDMPPGYVLIYLRSDARPPLFAPGASF